MNLADQIADDYQQIDGVEDVTLQPIASDGSSGTAVTGVKALRQRHANEAGPTRSTGAAVEEERIVWHLWTSTLADATPRVGDNVQAADGSTWKIRQAEPQTLGTRWRLVCIRNWSS